MVYRTAISSIVICALLVACPAGAASPQDTITEHLQAGDYAAAFTTADAWLAATARSARGELGAAAVADSLAYVFFDAGAGDEIAELLKRGIAFREQALGGDALELATPLQDLASVYFIFGRYADAVAPQQRALDIRRKQLTDDHVLVAISRRELGAVYYGQARYGDAEPLIRDALTYFEAHAPDSVQYIATYERDLAEICRIQNNYKEAEQRFVAALEKARLFLPAGDPGLVIYLNNLAGLYRDQGRFDASELLLEEALRILKDADVPQALPTPTLNLAEVYRFQGRYEDAEPLYLRALGLAEAYADPMALAEFHNQLALFYDDTERYEDAEREYRTALDILVGSPYASPVVLAQTQHDLATLLTKNERHADALRLYGEALKNREATLGQDHALVAATLIGMARATMQRARGNAAATSQADAPSAEALLDRAVAIFERTPADPDVAAQAYATRAELRRDSGNVRGAIDDLAAALRGVEQLRPQRGGGERERMRFFARYVEYYDRMVDWQVEAGDADAAFRYAEAARARVLIDQLSQGGVDWQQQVPPQTVTALQAQEAQLEKALGECQARMRFLWQQPQLSDDERSELRDLQSKCDELAVDYQRAYVRIDNLTRDSYLVGEAGGDPSDVPKTVVPKDGALLLYHIGKERSHLLVAHKGRKGVRAYALDVDDAQAQRFKTSAGPLTRERLAKILTGMDADGQGNPSFSVLHTLQNKPSLALAQSATRRLHAQLAALFDIVVPPDAWRVIRDAKEVLVVPHGSLHALPFEALVLSPESDDTPRYWLDKGPVVRYAPSATALAALARRKTPRSSPPADAASVLSVSNPAYADASLAPLPGTVHETEAVVSAFTTDDVRVLQGSAATESAVRDAIARRRFVHLATHGLINTQQSELLASLALAGPTGTGNTAKMDDDGFLQLFEIYALTLDADLVVLSACQTQAGRQAAGEGVMALSRGFLSAGARRVVASLWQVDDASTAALVGDFFTRVAGDDPGKSKRRGRQSEYARNLRDAKLAMRAQSQWSHPFYWAPFVLTGVK